MSHELDSHSFAYVECDIPPGMTIAEWRAQRAAERASVTRHRPMVVARTRLRQTADWIRHGGARALLRPRIARVRVPGRPASGAAPRGTPKPGEAA